MKKVIMAAMCMLALVSCGNKAKKNVVEEVADAVASAVDFNGEWAIVEVQGADVANASEKPFLGFNLEENKVYGNVGCNSITAGLLIDAAKGVLGIENPGSTKMLCADMSVEEAVLKAIVAVRGFEAEEDGSVVLKDADGAKLMVLKKNQ